MGQTYTIEAEVFSAGTHRGKPYTTDDLHDMVRNFNQFSVGQEGRKPLVNIPAVIGHEEDQEELQKSNLPAAAWTKALRVENRIGKDGKAYPMLIATMGNMPEQVATAIREGRIKTISPEVYDDAADAGVQGHGKMLRRIALLGADIPQVKVIDDIPKPRVESHGERSYWELRGLTFREIRKSGSKGYWVFSEVTPMFNRAKFMDDLKQGGMDTSKIPAQMPDEAMAEFSRYLEANKPAPPPNPDDIMPPKDEEEKKKFGERLKKYAAHCGYKMAEDGNSFTKELDQPNPPPNDNKAVSHSELKKFKEELFAELKGAKQEFETFTENAISEAKRGDVDGFLKTHLTRGAFLPVMLDRKNPANYFDELMRADNKHVVHKFSEGGREVTLTAFDIRKRQIAAMPPVVKFGERVGSDPTAPSDDPEIAKVQQIAHTPNMQHALEAKGSNPAEFVEKFSELRKTNKNLTAEKYTGVKAA